MPRLQTFSVRHCVWCLIPGVRRVHHRMEQRGRATQGHLMSETKPVVVMRSALSDLVPPGEPQCGNTPPGKDWPVCARPPDNHGGRHGPHESADFVWNNSG